MKITKTETIRRLKELPPDEPIPGTHCPLKRLYPNELISYYTIPAWKIWSWQETFMFWADGENFISGGPPLRWNATPRQCLEQLGVKLAY